MKVSCILATGGRPAFLRQTVRCFLRQTYPNRELIIIDDSPLPSTTLPTADPRIQYLHLDTPTPLGTKLNLGVDASTGKVVQKLDDDDYYHPLFLETTVGAVQGRDPLRALAAFDSFLVLIAATGKVCFSGKGWFAGGTFCFYRSLWEKQPFRDVPRAVDYWLLRDGNPEQIRIHAHERYILLRHAAGHTWTQMGDMDVTKYFERRKAYHKPLRVLIPCEDLPFYQALRRTDPSTAGATDA